jgi:phosphate acetyltransferase
MSHFFLKELEDRARLSPKRIVFSEGLEPRVMEAAKILEEKGLALPILVNNPADHPEFEEYAKILSELRGLALGDAREACLNPTMLATLILKNGDAKALLTGPSQTSKERVLPPLQVIKGREPGHKASGVFLMLLPESTNADAANGGVLLFADCAVNISPSVEELAQIALDSAATARGFGMEPKVAMLSFSTEGSADHPLVKRIQEAADLVQKLDPNLAISHDMQVDAALMDQIGASKAPHSLVAGHANVLIFPDLEAGNIAYKLVERLAGATAIGPLIQGLALPVAEVSRGSTAEDIVNAAVALQFISFTS